ncbi:MAG: helix-turn-helix domain-containing protein [Mucilaginibacter sp.]
MRSVSDLKTKAIIANIRKIRESRNYTQDYLAAKLRISQNAYSKIELGYSNITLSRLIEIAALLEVSLADLINAESEDITEPKLAVHN